MKRRVFVPLAMALLLGACATPFDLQGHRGARGLAPENTLAAFDVALAVGVSTLELDTGVTRDGVVVVMHDLRLNPDIARDAAGVRWIEAPGPTVASLDLVQLQAYDVGRLRPGSRYAGTLASQRPVDGARVPTLDALFERVRRLGADHVRFNIETKLDPLQPDATVDPRRFVQSLLDVVRRHGMQRRVTIQSFDWRPLRLAREQEPGIPTVCLTTRGKDGGNVADLRWTDGLKLADHGNHVPRLVHAAGCATWSPAFRDLDADSLAEARSLGLKTIPWTVNEPADIDRTLDLGVDGVISDYPDRVRDAMAKRGWKLPPRVAATGH